MDFLKYVGAICRPWQQLTDSAATCTTYTRSEQTLLSASRSLTPADDHGDITREIHYGSGKPSPRVTHGKRDETSGQTRFKPTDDSSIMPKFCSHHLLPQALTTGFQTTSQYLTSVLPHKTLLDGKHWRFTLWCSNTVQSGTQSSVYVTE